MNYSNFFTFWYVKEKLPLYAHFGGLGFMSLCFHELIIVRRSNSLIIPYHMISVPAYLLGNTIVNNTLARIYSYNRAAF